MLPSLARLPANVSTLQLTDLPPEIHALIAKIVGGNDPCNKLRRLCEAHKDLCGEEVFQTACSYFRYSTQTIRDAFLATRPAGIREAAAANPWYVCFRELCARPRLTDSVLNNAVYVACDNNMMHPTYGHISYWDVSRVTDMRGAFSNISRGFNENITLWDVSHVKTMQFMFYDLVRFNNAGQPLDWDVSRVRDMSFMFNDAVSFNQPLKWNVLGVKTMRGMFSGAREFNQPLDWDVSRVKDMTAMFKKAYAFNNADRPLKWNVSRVKDMSSMFEEARAFNQPLDWDVSSVRSMSAMFHEARSFNQPLDWDVSKVRHMYYMFNKATAFKQPVDLLFSKGPPNWPATDMFKMFTGSAQAPLPWWSIRQ